MQDILLIDDQQFSLIKPTVLTCTVQHQSNCTCSVKCWSHVLLCTKAMHAAAMWAMEMCASTMHTAMVWAKQQRAHLVRAAMGCCISAAGTAGAAGTEGAAGMAESRAWGSWGSAATLLHTLFAREASWLPPASSSVAGTGFSTMSSTPMQGVPYVMHVTAEAGWLSMQTSANLQLIHIS